MTCNVVESALCSHREDLLRTIGQEASPSHPPYSFLTLDEHFDVLLVVEKFLGHLEHKVDLLVAQRFKLELIRAVRWLTILDTCRCRGSFVVWHSACCWSCFRCAHRSLGSLLSDISSIRKRGLRLLFICFHGRFRPVCCSRHIGLPLHWTRAEVF